MCKRSHQLRFPGVGWTDEDNLASALLLHHIEWCRVRGALFVRLLAGLRESALEVSLELLSALVLGQR